MAKPSPDRLLSLLAGDKEADQAAAVERAGMKRWLQLTSKKHAAAKATHNPAAGAAADALAQLLKKPARNQA